MSDKTISILMSIHNGAKWLPAVLDSLKNQTYPHEGIEILILDNASTDGTKEILNSRFMNHDSRFSKFSLLEGKENVGFWAGFEKLLPEAKGDYIIALTDVILESHFIERAIATMEKDPKIGALQAKIYQYDSRFTIHDSRLIDTLGFRIERSRRVTNLGHGEMDTGQYDKQIEVFAVEGAVPIFYRPALLDCKIDGHFADINYRIGPFSYGDDLDMGWRMRLFGWRQILDPSVIAYHDRSTTKGVSHGLFDYVHRISERSRIDIRKRRLDWSNVRFTMLKNDYIINILQDLPWILARESAVFMYSVLFEPAVLLEAGRFFKLLPKMLAKRKSIMARSKATPHDIRKAFS